MENLSNETIDLIQSEKFNEDFWYFELGRAEKIMYESVDIENQFMSSFLDNGQRIWQSYKDKVENILCDKTKREPKENIKELTTGTGKDLVVNIITLLTTTYSLTLAIAIPVAALILKKGINSICM
jgi:hypothetical protein